jgi:Uma2 family endonuclease
MATIETATSIPPLTSGDSLTWEEFERRWDAAPEIKFAELIGGKVYMPPPLSDFHGGMDVEAAYFLKHYAARTRHCRVSSNATIRVLGDAPQPDLYLRIDESAGGKSRLVGKYVHGAPELVLEVCLSSAAYDLHEKKDLYLQAGIPEFITILLHEQEVRWHRLEGDAYVLLKEENGVIRSKEFPGLWLNTTALLKGDSAAMIATLESGLATDEHSRFVEELATRAAK